MNSIDDTSYLMKVRKLRKFALEAASKYPIKISTIDFIHYGANAIFKVTDTKHKKYMLRIHSKNYHTKEAILEEFKWLDHILKTTDLCVPKILQSRTGESLIEESHAAILESRYCSMFKWIEGRRFWKGINNNYAYQLGVVMGKLQHNGRSVRTKHRYYWDADGLVGTQKAKFWNIEKLSDISPKQQELITAARQCVHHKLKQYEKSYPGKSGLIHADLNPNNIIVNKNHYAVIDFDDCGIGLYGYDIANALHAFQHLIKGSPEKDFNALSDALFEGYSEYMPFTQNDINMLPYFLLAQKLNGIGALELRKDNSRLHSYFLNAVEEAIRFFTMNKLHQ